MFGWITFLGMNIKCLLYVVFNRPSFKVIEQFVRVGCNQSAV